MDNFVFERYSQSLGAGQMWRASIAANEIRIAEAFWPVSVELRRGGRTIGTASNMLAGDYVRGVDFDEWVVINGGNPQTVTVKLASGQSGSDRIAGEVSVISGEVQRSKSGASFWGGGGISAAAGVYSHCQLWNPVASPKLLVVRQIMVTGGPGVAGGFNIMSSSSPLASLFSTANALPKKLGGVVSVAENRIENNAVKLGGFLAGIYTMAGESKTFTLAEPIIVSPGYGLIVVGYQVNQYSSCIFQFYEEAV